MRKLQAVAAGWLIVVASATAQAGVTFHNGTIFTSFPAGSGDVNVEIFVLDDSSGSLFFIRSFLENATHILEYVYGVGEPPVVVLESNVNNSTGAAWGDFHIDLLGGADFLDSSLMAIPDGADPLLEELIPILPLDRRNGSQLGDSARV